MRMKVNFLAAAAFALLCTLALAGCNKSGGQELVIAFQPQEDVAKLTPNAERLAEFVEEKTGVRTRAYLPTDYVAVVEALRGKQADVAYFSAWPYLLSEELAGTEVFAAEKRDDKTFYQSQWYVRADSEARSLSDLAGKRIAFTSPTSTSGYLFPLAALVEEGILETGEDPAGKFAEVTFAGGYEQALKALVNGQVDAAAASDYAPGRYLSEEERRGIRVLRAQGPVPTHVLAWREDLPPELKEKVRAAFLALNDPANREVLKAAYGAQEIVAVDRTHIEPLAKAVKATGREAELARFRK